MASNASATKMWNSFRDSILESFFRNTGIPYRNLIGLLLGFISAVLLLNSGVLTIASASQWFVGVLLVTMLTLVVVRPYQEKKIDRFAWGLLVIIILGFGLGTLEYQTRSWWIWSWRQLLRINTDPERLLLALFLIGVILGFFVVRNWGKEQKDFVSSLSAVLSGAFVATILGKLQETSGGIDPLRAFTFYALGFALSGTINLMAAARLTANYTNKRSISSRAIIDFLYGSERTKLIDGYFLQNFKDDPDYARARLTEAFVEYRKLVAREVAERMEKRMKEREQQEKQARSKRHYYYELLSIESEEGDDEEKPKKGSKISDKDRKHFIIYRELGGREEPADEGSENKVGIDEDMFRVGISARWQDTLEYISAPGEYRVAFPYLRSVSGLALLFRQTIVMDRDRNKRFRNKDHVDGVSPREVEQPRGLDEIDFLSYIAIPIVGRMGTAGENPLGVVTIDCRLFVCSELEGATRIGERIFRVEVTPRQLTEYAAQLYEHQDPDVRYIENVTKIIVPVMELYSKCRVGAT